MRLQLTLCTARHIELCAALKPIGSMSSRLLEPKRRRRRCYRRLVIMVLLDKLFENRPAMSPRRGAGQTCHKRWNAYGKHWPSHTRCGRATPIKTHDVKRVFADIDTDHGDFRIKLG